MSDYNVVWIIRIYSDLYFVRTKQSTRIALRCVFLYKKKVEKRRRIGYDENGRFIGEMIENSIRHVLCQCCDVDHGFEYQAVQK